MAGADPESPAGWRPGPFPGVLRRSLQVHPDPRGSFAELWRAGWTADLDPGAGGTAMTQANLSRSAPGVLRGLHLHRRQADLWLVVDGHPLVGLVDLRDALAGRGPAQSVTVESAPGDAFYLPAGVAHGFHAPDAITLMYLVTNEYDGSDELGFRWDDPDAAVPWVDRSPILSDRDRDAPSLAALLERLRAEAPTEAADVDPPEVPDPERELRHAMLRLEALRAEHAWVLGNVAELERENARLREEAAVAAAHLETLRVPIGVYQRVRGVLPTGVRRPIKSLLARLLRVG